MDSEARQRSQRQRRRERARELQQQREREREAQLQAARERERNVQQPEGEGGEDRENSRPAPRPASRPASRQSAEEDTSPPAHRERPRPRPRKQRRESHSASSQEEDIIDGFAISSFSSMDALENESPNKLVDRRNRDKAPARRGMEDGENGKAQKRRKKTKMRSSYHGKTDDENTRPEGTNANGPSQRASSRDRLSDASTHSSSGRGYMCDSESEDDRNSDAGSENLFRAVTSNPPVTRPAPPTTTLNSSFSISSITANLNHNRDEKREQPVSSAPSGVAVVNNHHSNSYVHSHGHGLSNNHSHSSHSHSHSHSQGLSQSHGHGHTHTHSSHSHSHSQVHNHSRGHEEKEKERESINRDTAFSKTNSWTSPNHQPPRIGPTPHISPIVGPNPSFSLSLTSHTPTFSPSLGPPPPPPHTPHSMSMFSTLPPPPPLTSSSFSLPGTGPSFGAGREQDMLRRELDSRFLASQDRPGPAAGPAAEGRGPAPVRPFLGLGGEVHQHQHQHMHQHQHTHNHSYHPPLPLGGSLVPTPAPHMFDKFPKIDAAPFYRPTLGSQLGIPPYPAGLSPMLPHNAGPFGSGTHGAFQPKADDARSGFPLGRIPGAPLGISKEPTPKKTGKWCAVHVHVAWQIYHHQQKAKAEAQGEGHKPDLLGRPPGGPNMFNIQHRSHELSCPTSMLQSAGGLPHTPATPFGPAPGPSAHNSFLSPPGPFGMSPFARPNFGPLGTSLGFGGLGNGSMFGNRDMPAIPGLGNPHDPWNRLHRTPPSFPTPPNPNPWGPSSLKPESQTTSLLSEAEREQREKEKQEEREREKDRERKREREREREHERDRSKSPASEHHRNDSRDHMKEHDRERNHANSHDNGENKSRTEDNRSRDGRDSARSTENRPLQNGPDSRISPYRFPGDKSSGQHDGKSDSAFNNVAKPNDVKVKEEKREEDGEVLVVSERQRHSASSLERMERPRSEADITSHPGIVPTMGSISMLERTRMMAGQFGLPDRPRLPGPHLGMWPADPMRDPFRDSYHRAFDFNRAELHHRNDFMAREAMMRDHMIHRLTAPNMLPHDRFREREPLEYNRDSLLRNDMERAAHLRTDDRDRFMREEFERSKMLGMVPGGADMHPMYPGGMHYPRPTATPPSSHTNSVHKASSSPASNPPPLIPSASANSAPRSTNNSPATNPRSAGGSPAQEQNTSKDRDVSVNSTEDSQAR
ncbi:autism susceptibility gene 2 protein homolog isoform X5 [Branchiostoma floridae x Branchiostoma belcheri]